MTGVAEPGCAPAPRHRSQPVEAGPVLAAGELGDGGAVLARARRRPGAAAASRRRRPARVSSLAISGSRRRTRTPSCDASVTTAVSNRATCHQLRVGRRDATACGTVRPRAWSSTRLARTRRLSLGGGPAAEMLMSAARARVPRQRGAARSRRTRRAPAGSPRRPRAAVAQHVGPCRKSSTALISVWPGRTASPPGTGRAGRPGRGPPCRPSKLAVQRRGDHAVAQVEVPVPLVPVLPAEVGVPDAGAGQRDGRECRRAGPVAELDVVPLEEQRQRVAELRRRSRPGSGRTTSRCTRCRRGVLRARSTDVLGRQCQRAWRCPRPSSGRSAYSAPMCRWSGCSRFSICAADDRRLDGAGGERGQPDEDLGLAAARRRP